MALTQHKQQNVKFKVLIVDDEDSGRQAVKILLEKTFWNYIDSIVFASDLEAAREKILSSYFDLVFLDINLKGLSAFDLLNHVHKSSKIIFVSAYSEYLLQALRNKAFDYLIKPIKEVDLINCLNRFVGEKESEKRSWTIQVKSRGMNRILNINEIYYIKGDGPYSTIYLSNDHIKTAKTIKSLFPKLAFCFIRVHKSYLVNRNFIKSFNIEKVILQNEIWLPVSRTGFKILSEH